MNLTQRTAPLGGLLLIALMLLVPPWVEAPSARFDIRSRGSSYDPGGGHAGYGFVFAPQKRYIVGTGQRVSGGSVRIDLTTLAVHCALVAALTAGAAVALHGRK